MIKSLISFPFGQYGRTSKTYGALALPIIVLTTMTGNILNVLFHFMGAGEM